MQQIHYIEIMWEKIQAECKKKSLVILEVNERNEAR